MKPLKPMRVLVCGGRAKTLQSLGIDPGAVKVLLTRTLNQISANGKRPVTIIHGGAPGVDNWSGDWAYTTRTPYEVYPADWDKYGNVAGLLRNTEMLDKGKPDVVLAFPGGRGTADMVKKAREAGVRTLEVKLDAH